MSFKKAKPSDLIYGLTSAEISAFCLRLKQPSFRAKQIWKWLYSDRVSDWRDMKNIPKNFREALAEKFLLTATTPTHIESGASARATKKILFKLQDGDSIEAVLIPAREKTTLCISSQVGCKFRCSFCASGQAGFKRNLETGEIVGQIIAACGSREISIEKPSNIVFMGIGEPLDNYENVLAAVRIINDKDGLAIGARRITISTCGIIPAIKRLQNEGLQTELSISLHAPNDSLRSKLIPINKKYPLKELLKTCREYTLATGRIITFEYTMIEGINDSINQATELSRLLRGLKCRVNLIPLSPVPEFEGCPSDYATAEKFSKTLNHSGINTTIRASKGLTLNAACGQLRGRHSKAEA